MPPNYSTIPTTYPSDADDERSLPSTPSTTSLPGLRRRLPAPQFSGQDVRPTSKKELMGWYSYAWAAEVFVVCGVGSFIPVTLEQLARENGVLLSDPTTPCVGTAEGLTMSKEERCVVYIGGMRIDTASFALYTFSFSVFLQSLIIVSMSGAADHGSHRKQLLLIFALLGSIATTLFLFITPQIYILGGVLATLGNIGFGASFVLLNAFLPVLVRNHPDILFSSPSSSALPSESTPLRPKSPSARSSTSLPTQNKDSPALQLSTKISSYGIAIGYAAAVLLQIGGILLVMKLGSSLRSLEIVLFSIGLWWLVFTIPAALWLRPRPGPPLPRPKSTPGSNLRRERSWWGYITYSWAGLYKTLKRARQLKDVMLFLAAWFLVSDGVATVSGTAVLFAKTNLKMSPPAVALISVVSTLMGMVGAFAWPRIQRWTGRTPSQTILLCILLFLMIPVYALLGFIPAIKRSGIGGLTQPWEMYVLGAVYGFVLGGISGYCRSVFGELIPPGSEAAFYALYAVTDKGSSIFGPTIVGALTDKYHDIRVSFWFLAALLATPVPLIWMVDVERGKREGKALAEEELRLAREEVDDEEEEGGVEVDHDAERV